ncbi:MAG TPA: GNAT family N-acetyltransferase [Stellaceae bacterium]
MIIRDALPEDAAATCRVLRRSITELCTADHGNDPAILAAWLANKTPEIVHSWIAQPGGSILLAIEDNRLLGVAGVTDKGEITLNYVSPDERFRGVSRALLRAAEARARERGNSRCTLISSETAHRFYLSAGYADVGAPQGKYGTAGSHPMTKALHTDAATVRSLAQTDRDVVEAFLKKHAAKSMLLRSNLYAAGLQDRGEIYHASYLGAFRDGALIGLIAHCWNGMLLPQAPEAADLLALQDAALALPCMIERGITGICGDDRQVGILLKALDLAEMSVRKNSHEKLLALSLAYIVAPPDLAQGFVSCRRAELRDLPFLLEWRFAYTIEALGAARENIKAEEERAALRRQIERGDSFVLEHSHSRQPLSHAAFNAMVPDTVQVGGVFTPPVLRGKGYARAVVAGQLQIARSEGVEAAVLFTASSAGIRAYEAVGFREIGEFGLVLLKKPWFPPAGR